MRLTSSRSSIRRTRWLELALHHAARLVERRRVAGAALQDRERVAQRRERVAQLVRQRGEELVLPPVGVLERRQRALLLGDVADDAEHPLAAVGAAQDAAARRDPAQLAVGPDDAVLGAEHAGHPGLGDRPLAQRPVVGMEALLEHARS